MADRAILVVGREELFIEMLQRFPPARYTVLFAPDARAAAPLVASRKPVLIVTPLRGDPIIVALLKATRIHGIRVLGLDDKLKKDPRAVQVLPEDDMEAIVQAALGLVAGPPADPDAQKERSDQSKLELKAEGALLSESLPAFTDDGPTAIAPEPAFDNEATEVSEVNVDAMLEDLEAQRAAQAEAEKAALEALGGSTAEVETLVVPEDARDAVVRRPEEAAEAETRVLPGDLREALVKEPAPQEPAEAETRVVPEDVREALVKEPAPQEPAEAEMRVVPEDVREALVKEPAPQEPAEAETRVVPEDVRDALARGPAAAAPKVRVVQPVPAKDDREAAGGTVDAAGADFEDAQTGVVPEELRAELVRKLGREESDEPTAAPDPEPERDNEALAFVPTVLAEEGFSGEAFEEMDAGAAAVELTQDTVEPLDRPAWDAVDEGGAAPDNDFAEFDEAQTWVLSKSSAGLPGVGELSGAEPSGEIQGGEIQGGELQRAGEIEGGGVPPEAVAWQPDPILQDEAPVAAVGAEPPQERTDLYEPPQPIGPVDEAPALGEPRELTSSALAAPRRAVTWPFHVAVAAGVVALAVVAVFAYRHASQSREEPPFSSPNASLPKRHRPDAAAVSPAPAPDATVPDAAVPDQAPAPDTTVARTLLDRPNLSKRARRRLHKKLDLLVFHARYLLKHKRVGRAKETLASAARIGRDYRIHMLLSRTHRLSGEPREAAQEMERAVPLAPKRRRPPLLYQLGILHLEQGDKDRACVAFRAAAKLRALRVVLKALRKHCR